MFISRVKKKKKKLQDNVVSLSFPHIWSGWLSSRQELSLTQEHQPKQHRGPKPDLFALGHLIWLSLSLSIFFYNHLSSFGKQTKKKKKNINVVIHFVQQSSRYHNHNLLDGWEGVYLFTSLYLSYSCWKRQHC